MRYHTPILCHRTALGWLEPASCLMNPINISLSDLALDELTANKDTNIEDVHESHLDL